MSLTSVFNFSHYESMEKMNPFLSTVAITTNNFHYSGICYAIQNETVNGYQAHAQCAEMNGVLANVDSTDISNLLLQWNGSNKWFGKIFLHKIQA